MQSQLTAASLSRAAVFLPRHHGAVLRHESVMPPRQFEQRKRRLRSGTSPPAEISPSRSASAECRNALHQTCTRT
jgi:hypothetical protein